MSFERDTLGRQLHNRLTPAAAAFPSRGRQAYRAVAGLTILAVLAVAPLLSSG